MDASPVERCLDSLSNRLLQIDSLIEEREDRFRDVSEVETDRFIENMKNNNTKRKTICDLKLLHWWMEAKLGERRHAEFIPPSELDSVLARNLDVFLVNCLGFSPSYAPAILVLTHQQIWPPAAIFDFIC